MTSELCLPNPVMEIVLSYMDTSTYAQMAQICSTWMRIIYRKSLWDKECLTYKPFPDLMFDVPPKNARHIGATRKVCFIYWLKKVYPFRSDMFPLGLERRIDANDFLVGIYRYWKRLNSPCLIKEHHKISDLLRIPLPNTISKTEQKRILYRVINQHVSSTKNSYACYIELQHIYVTPFLVSPRVVNDDTISSDPLHRYRSEVASVQQTRMAKLNTFIRNIFDTYSLCSNIIMRRGMAEFERNDIWYNSNRETIWALAGFKLPS